MVFSPSAVLSILVHYKYFVIFPITIVEGPIIMIISGFLVYLGQLNAGVAFIMLTVADIIGDSLYYLIGKYWRKSAWVKKWAGFLGYDEKSEEFLEEHFRRHKGKTFLLAKISHGLGGSVQVAAGIAGVKYSEFLGYSILGTLPKVLVLMCVGFYAGSSYVKIDEYLNYAGLIMVGIACLIVALYIFLSRYAKNYFTKQ